VSHRQPQLFGDLLALPLSASWELIARIVRGFLLDAPFEPVAAHVTWRTEHLQVCLICHQFREPADRLDVMDFKVDAAVRTLAAILAPPVRADQGYLASAQVGRGEVNVC